MMLGINQPGPLEDGGKVVKIAVDISDGNHCLGLRFGSFCRPRPRPAHYHQEQKEEEEDGNTTTVGVQTDWTERDFLAFYSQASPDLHNDAGFPRISLERRVNLRRLG